MLVSTSILGGHVDTIGPFAPAARRRRRLHSDEFKADAVAAASQPGVSMASVALARGINANLLRRWVREAEVPPAKALAKAAAVASTFVPVQLPDPVAPAGDIRIDVRRGATTITVAWPMAAAAECASWMRELLR
jgi:transposase